jgi:tRNA (guanine37-N1)-methyltransferase
VRFYILTIFPEIVRVYWENGILSKAAENGLLSVGTIDLREFSRNKYRKIDKPIYGAGRGMLFEPGPLSDAIDSVKAGDPQVKTVFLTPSGKKFDNRMARELAKEESLLLIAARYEGIDERIIATKVDYEISAGDYVLTGGELPAMAVADAVSRFLPGAVKDESVSEESFENGLLEHGHYTEPAVFDGLEVPEVLRSGDHRAVAEYRFYESLKKTYFNRPDLFAEWLPELKTGASGNMLTRIKKENKEWEKILKHIEKISKEWKNVGRNKQE